MRGSSSPPLASGRELKILKGAADLRIERRPKKILTERASSFQTQARTFESDMFKTKEYLRIRNVCSYVLYVRLGFMVFLYGGVLAKS